MSKPSHPSLPVPGSDLDEMCRIAAEGAPPLTAAAVDLLRTQYAPAVLDSSEIASVVPLSMTETADAPERAA